VETIASDYFNGKKWTGAAVSSPAELVSTKTEVFVSNRGYQTFLGSAESGIRIFTVEKDGAQLVSQQSLATAGPVRHFSIDKGATKIYSGVNLTKPHLIETFVRKHANEHAPGEFEKVGEADVGMDVMCIARKVGVPAV
jgi:hypothetical protein